MKIRIEVDDAISDEEVIIRCREISSTIQTLQQTLLQSLQKVKLVFYKNNVEYYLPVCSTYFFETAQTTIDAHTKDDVYKIKYKLYELEDLLPRSFVRISKSTIINVDFVYSIDKNLTSSGCVRFYHTHKQVFVSRNYYKALKNRLDERRTYHE